MGTNTQVKQVEGQKQYDTPFTGYCVWVRQGQSGKYLDVKKCTGKSVTYKDGSTGPEFKRVVSKDGLQFRASLSKKLSQEVVDALPLGMLMSLYWKAPVARQEDLVVEGL